MFVHGWMPRNEKMCKDKWNGLNSNKKPTFKLSQRRQGPHIILRNQSKEFDMYHLPHESNRKCYKIVEAFRGEQIINARVHENDLQAKGDVH
jgi:hypothetical protein